MGNCNVAAENGTKRLLLCWSAVIARDDGVRTPATRSRSFTGSGAEDLLLQSLDTIIADKRA